MSNEVALLFLSVVSAQDVAYHAFASLLYLSASVLLAYVTINLADLSSLDTYSLFYKLDIAAVVSPGVLK